LLEGYVLKYLWDLGKVKQNQVIVDNLKCGLSNHLKGQKTLPIVMAKDIMCTLAMFEKTCSNKQVTQNLDVDCRNIMKVIERRQFLNTSGDFLWVNKKIRKWWGHALSEVVVQCIVAFWTFYTTISLNEKDITQRRILVWSNMMCMLPNTFNFPMYITLANFELFCDCWKWWY
jgi:hypothetical protein